MMPTRPSHTSDENKSPAIVWDGLGLSNEYSGVGSYGKHLYEALGHLGVRPKVVLHSKADVTYVQVSDRIEMDIWSRINAAKRLYQLKPIFPLFAYRQAQKHLQKTPSQTQDAMIYHGLSNINLPCFGHKRGTDKFVITLHDIIPLLVGEHSALALQMQSLMPRVLERADHIITGSKWARDTVLARFGAKYSGKISALGYGTETPKGDWPSASSHKTIDGLSIARGESYKRLEIIEVIARKHPDHRFAVVTCESGRRQLAAAPTNLQVHVQLTGRELEQLMANSKIFIHPSLFEGWCLPAADALVRGLHVLYCQGSGIDEVVEGNTEQATGLSRAASLADWCEAFTASISVFKPAEKTTALKKWSDVGQKTLQIYQSLV